MPFTRPFAIDQAYANASDYRKQNAAVFPREGVLPDPVTTATAGIAYPNGGWNVGARIFTAVARRGTAPFSQAYGSALISNDSQATAWTIPAAPATGSRIDLLWFKATDPTQGDATTTPSGEAVARAVPIFGVTSGVAATTPTAPALPSGAVLIASVSTASTATSIANSVITQAYAFANVLGGIALFRTKAEADAAASAASIGEEAQVIADRSSYVLGLTSSGVKTWSRRGRNVIGRGMDNASGSIVQPGALSALYGSTTFEAPAGGDLHARAQVWTVTRNTNVVAGSILVFVDGVQQSADGARGRINSHGLAGPQIYDVDLTVPLSPGSHTVSIRISEDPGVAALEFFEVTWNYALQV